MNEDDERNSQEPARRTPAPPAQRRPTRRWLAIGALLVLVAAGLSVATYGFGWLRPGTGSPPAPEATPAAPNAAPGAEPFVYSPAADHFTFRDAPGPVPQLAFADATGRSLSLSDFRGRAIVLNLWATWCVPCRTEMPSLERLQAEFDPTQLLVLALSGDDVSQVAKFYQELGLHGLGIYTSRTGGEVTKLGLSGLPGTLLIDAEGNEIGRKLGAAEWDRPEIVDLLVQHFDLPPPVAPAQGAP